MMKMRMSLVAKSEMIIIRELMAKISSHSCPWNARRIRFATDMIFTLRYVQNFLQICFVRAPLNLPSFFCDVHHCTALFSHIYHFNQSVRSGFLCYNTTKLVGLVLFARACPLLIGKSLYKKQEILFSHNESGHTRWRNGEESFPLSREQTKTHVQNLRKNLD